MVVVPKPPGTGDARPTRSNSHLGITISSVVATIWRVSALGLQYCIAQWFFPTTWVVIDKLVYRSRKPALDRQEAEIFGFSRVVVPYTRKNQGVESSRTRRDGWTDPGRRSLPISAPAPTGVQDVDAFAHEKIRGRRGSIEVVECR